MLAGADEGDPSEADPSYAAAQAAQAQEETGEEGGETLGDVPPGMVRKAVFDSELGDYVVRVVPTETAAPARSADEYHDEFEIGPAYFQGDNAYFDYRWINDDPKRSLTDRKNGFVPVKKALDTLHREEGGCVRMGDLILARRPKDITAQRASEQSRLHDRIVGEVDEFNAEGRRAGVETFGGISAETDELPRARAQERVPEPRGRKSFAFPALPFQRDKVAERHGSVGG